jgi:(4-alkanoyl-5-oxo-2,5-dihydrofuran-3-yl)methyl phosphate reductase
MSYLITGATGDIGSRVVQLLLQHGVRPRVFVRDAAKARARYGDRVDIFVGDLADRKSLLPALQGAEALFLINSGPEIPSRDGMAAHSAKATGVKHLVKLSSMDAQQNVGTGAWHAQGEAAIRATRIVFTFVQPSGFMSNALGWAALIKAEGIVRSPTADGKIAFIHPDDIAAVAAKVLLTDEYRGDSLPITGPEALSYFEMTQKIGAATNRQLRFQAIQEKQESDYMTDSGDSAAMVKAHLSIYRAIREGRLAKVTDNVERILGRKPKTFDQWAQENAATFG